MHAPCVPNGCTCKHFLLALPVAKVMALQPRYGTDLAAMVPGLVLNLAEVREALAEAMERWRSGADAGAEQSLTGA